MTVEEILSRLRGVCKCGRGFSALCPAHEDRNSSLSVSGGDAGKILLHCVAGCSPEAGVGALRLQMKDLFPAGSSSNGGGGGSARPEPTATVQHPPGLTLETLAESKKLPCNLLSSLGISTITNQ